ncbi:Os02g0254233, partial [Oryza sativa Japonica Group]
GEPQGDDRPWIAAVVAQKPGFVPVPARVVVPLHAGEERAEQVVIVVHRAAVAETLEEAGRCVVVVGEHVVDYAGPVQLVHVVPCPDERRQKHRVARQRRGGGAAGVPPALLEGDEVHQQREAGLVDRHGRQLQHALVAVERYVEHVSRRPFVHEPDARLAQHGHARYHQWQPTRGALLAAWRRRQRGVRLGHEALVIEVEEVVDLPGRRRSRT